MADQRDRQNLPRLVGYESWLYQMPCFGSSGDVFVSVPLLGQGNLSGEPPTRWLIALGDTVGNGETASHLKDLLEKEVTGLAVSVDDPASILKTLNHDLADLVGECNFATLFVAVIDGERHELTLANAGNVCPFLRRADRRVEPLAEEISGLPLWIDPGQTYDNDTVPVGPGEVVIFHSDGMTAVIDQQGRLFDVKHLRQAIVQAPDGAASVGQSILDAIRRFGDGRAQMDDISLLCLGRLVPTTVLGG